MRLRRTMQRTTFAVQSVILLLEELTLKKCAENARKNTRRNAQKNTLRNAQQNNILERLTPHLFRCKNSFKRFIIKVLYL